MTSSARCLWRWIGGRALWLCFFARLLDPIPAQAYVRTTNGQGQSIRWRAPPRAVLVERPPEGARLSWAELLDATRAAAARWSYPQVPCTSLQLQVEAWAPGEASEGVVRRDGRSAVMLRTRSSCQQASNPARRRSWCHDLDMVALTSVFLRPGDTGSREEKDDAAEVEIAEADIELNAVTFELVPETGDGTPTADAGANARSLEAVLLHELGHLLGFADSCSDDGTKARDHAGNLVPACAGAPVALRRSVMVPHQLAGDRVPLELSGDDRLGVCTLYPRDRGPAERPAMAAGCGACRVGDGHDRHGSWCALLLSSLLLRSVMRRTPVAVRQPTPERLIGE